MCLIALASAILVAAGPGSERASAEFYAPTFAVPAAPDRESVRYIPELAWHAVRDPDDCVIQCWDQHEFNVHVANLVEEQDGVNKRMEGSHTEPAAGSCEVKHPSCEPNLATVTQLNEAIRTADVARLRALLGQNSNAYVAWERGAIQVLDCTRTELVAHIPLTNELLRAVAD